MPINPKANAPYAPPGTNLLPSSTLVGGHSPEQHRIEMELKRKMYINKHRQDVLMQRMKTDALWEAKLKNYIQQGVRSTSLVLLDAGGNIRQSFTLENIGDFNSIFGSIAGNFSAGFERNSFLTKSVNISEKLSHIQLQNITKNLKFAGYIGTITGASISFLQLDHNQYSNQALVRFGVDGVMTAIGFVNPYGIPIGFSAALVFDSMNAAGGLDWFYDKFDNKPRNLRVF